MNENRGAVTSVQQEMGGGEAAAAAAGAAAARAGLNPSSASVDPTLPLIDDERKSLRTSIERLPPEKALKILNMILMHRSFLPSLPFFHALPPPFIPPSLVQD